MFTGEDLITAARNGEVDLVARILENQNNIPVDYRNTEDGGTALMAAVTSGELSVCRILLNKGADIFAANSFGRTAVNIAEESNKHEIIAVLEEHYTEVGLAAHLLLIYVFHFIKNVENVIVDWAVEGYSCKARIRTLFCCQAWRY
jgi:ankyrin repeat protein